MPPLSLAARWPKEGHAIAIVALVRNTRGTFMHVAMVVTALLVCDACDFY